MQHIRTHSAKRKYLDWLLDYVVTSADVGYSEGLKIKAAVAD
jgi:hypothetical protein